MGDVAAMIERLKAAAAARPDEMARRGARYRATFDPAAAESHGTGKAQEKHRDSAGVDRGRFSNLSDEERERLQDQGVL